MRSSVKNIKLNTVDDLFSTEESRQDANREKVIEIPLVELYPFKHHPFKVVDDERRAPDHPGIGSVPDLCHQ